jgi:hypothetical protein
MSDHGGIVKTVISCFVLTIVIAAPAAALDVWVDYDVSADFSSYKTFKWGPTPNTSLSGESPMMHSRLKNGIEYYLVEGGKTEVAEDPDLYVTYHTNSTSELAFNISGMGYGFSTGWTWDPYWGGMHGFSGGGGTSASSVTTYPRGTLVIDIWDARTKNIVWRGTAEGAIHENPKKAAKQIEKILKKMVQKFQKMKADYDKK